MVVVGGAESSLGGSKGHSGPWGIIKLVAGSMSVCDLLAEGN